MGDDDDMYMRTFAKLFQPGEVPLQVTPLFLLARQMRVHCWAVHAANEREFSSISATRKGFGHDEARPLRSSSLSLYEMRPAVRRRQPGCEIWMAGSRPSSRKVRRAFSRCRCRQARLVCPQLAEDDEGSSSCSHSYLCRFSRHRYVVVRMRHHRLTVQPRRGFAGNAGVDQTADCPDRLSVGCHSHAFHCGHRDESVWTSRRPH